MRREEAEQLEVVACKPNENDSTPHQNFGDSDYLKMGLPRDVSNSAQIGHLSI